MSLKRAGENVSLIMNQEKLPDQITGFIVMSPIRAVQSLKKSGQK
jgi:hypothetical protein